MSNLVLLGPGLVKKNLLDFMHPFGFYMHQMENFMLGHVGFRMESESKRLLSKFAPTVQCSMFKWGSNNPTGNDWKTSHVLCLVNWIC